MFEIKKTKLDYYTSELEEGQFKLSPSSVGKFLNNSKAWYDSQILGISDFKGNTNTVLGTCVHYMAERYVLGGKVSDEDLEEIHNYINNNLFNPDVDINIVREEFFDMGMVLIEWLKDNPTDIAEEFISCEPKPDFFVAGSVDAVYKTTIRDYKTCKNKPSMMGEAHKLQANLYAYIYDELDRPMDTVEIVYIQRKTKTLPPRVWAFKEAISKKEREVTKGIVEQVYTGVSMVKENPELLSVIFRDNPTCFY